MYEVSSPWYDIFPLLFSSVLFYNEITGPFSKVTTKSGIHETTVGGITLQVLNGDITTEKTDVIVNSSNKEFTLKSGKVTELVEGW